MRRQLRQGGFVFGGKVTVDLVDQFECAQQVFPFPSERNTEEISCVKAQLLIDITINFLLTGFRINASRLA